MPPLASRNLPRWRSVAPVKAPFSWPKRIDFDEIFRQRAAIDGDERLAAPVGGALDRPRDDFFADARFAFEQDRDRRFRGPLAEPDNPVHVGAFAAQILEGQRARGPAVEPAHLVFQRFDAQRILDRDLQPLGADRLDDEIAGARAHGRDHRLDRAMRRLHDGRNDALLVAQALQHRHAIDIRHDEVENQKVDVRRARFKPLQRGRAAVERFALIAKTANKRFQNATLHWIVVDNQHE